MRPQGRGRFGTPHPAIPAPDGENHMPAAHREDEAMSTPQPGASAANRNRTTFFAVAILLILSFLWRVLTPAHEFPRPGARFLTMGLDALLIVALVGMK